jgi:anti-sigma factor RsiW
MKNLEKKHYREEDLLLHYYGESGVEERFRLEKHLAGCKDCREAWHALQRTLEAIPRVSLAISPEQSRRFAARVARRAGGRQLARGWLWGGALTTAALLALTLSSRPPGLLPDLNPKVVAEGTIVKDLDLLQNLELLEQLDLLQEMDGQG